MSRDWMQEYRDGERRARRRRRIWAVITWALMFVSAAFVLFVVWLLVSWLIVAFA